MKAQPAYEELVRGAREAALLASCAGLLEWDEETYLPRDGIEYRGEQVALLAGLHHERVTDPRISECLAAVEGSALVGDPLCPEAVNVREWRRAYDRATRLSRGLVEELARATTVAEQVWVEAYRNADWDLYRPWLEKVVALKCREAETLAPEGDRYDALLEEYEPAATGEQVAGLFTALRGELTRLVGEITASPRRPDPAILERRFPLGRQRRFGEAVARAVGFDFRRGRLDTSPHPFFITLGPDDCRITTRYRQNEFGEALFGVLHEVGHGLYEQGLDRAWHGTPMGEAVSLGVHESQARLWENTVGRSRPFWEHFYSTAVRAFPLALGGVGPDEFFRAVNRVAPTPVRVGADEVTYNLHILVRFELERALVSGDLRVAELPGAWAEKYHRYLGITPANHTEGCLQDSHWGAGLVGYFPTYTLGNLFAAQLYARAADEVADLERDMARGHFDGLLGWLRDRVHRHGHRYPAARLIEHATGAPPDQRPLLASLHRKYGELYDL